MAKTQGENAESLQKKIDVEPDFCNFSQAFVYLSAKWEFGDALLAT